MKKQVDSNGFLYDIFIDYQPGWRGKNIAINVKGNLMLYKYRHLPKSQAEQISFKRIYLYTQKFSGTEALQPEVKDALIQSRFLLILCSPGTAHSRRTAESIRLFTELGREDHILLLLVKGEPRESFPVDLINNRRYALIAANGGMLKDANRLEPLAADIRAKFLFSSIRKFKKTERLRIISAVIGCSYDDLKHRYRERRIRRIVILLVIAILSIGSPGGVALFEWFYAQNNRQTIPWAEERLIAQQHDTTERMELTNHLMNFIKELPDQFADSPEYRSAVKEVLRLIDMDVQQGDAIRAANALKNVKFYSYLHLEEADAALDRFAKFQRDFEVDIPTFIQTCKKFNRERLRHNLISGAYITEIAESSPARQAGLKVGDIIIKLDGERYYHTEILDNLQDVEHKYRVKVTYLRLNSGGKLVAHTASIMVKFNKLGIRYIPI